ncbi:MAG: hypothetical protein Ta2A_20560 [Treponemataceae bacterium]|nr:MAG: hypothetical protein Ta2A_20560 [Treponemataceae bacterium]
MALPVTQSVLDAHPHELSGGQCQRVAIAQSLALKPKLLIADEILSALDERNKMHIMELLKKNVRESNISLLFICHDKKAESFFCDRTMGLRK